MHLRLWCSDAEPCRWCRWVLDEADGQPCDAHLRLPAQPGVHARRHQCDALPGRTRGRARPRSSAPRRVEAGREADPEIFDHCDKWRGRQAAAPAPPPPPFFVLIGHTASLTPY